MTKDYFSFFHFHLPYHASKIPLSFTIHFLKIFQVKEHVTSAVTKAVTETYGKKGHEPITFAIDSVQKEVRFLAIAIQ